MNRGPYLSAEAEFAADPKWKALVADIVAADSPKLDTEVSAYLAKDFVLRLIAHKDLVRRAIEG